MSNPLGTEIVTWRNVDLQNSVVRSIRSGILFNKPPEVNCLLALKRIIRKCIQELTAGSVGGDLTSSTELKLCQVMAVIEILFGFVGALCKGENKVSQSFFTGEDGSNRQILNITLELSLLANALQSTFLSLVKYLNFDQFYEKLGPLIWSLKDTAKRRFLAWHDPRNNIFLFARFVSALGQAYDNLSATCCDASQTALAQAVLKAPNLLEFLGLMQLQVSTKIPGSEERNFSGFPVEIVWQGGKPLEFYYHYTNELNLLGILNEQSDYNQMMTKIKSWDLDRIMSKQWNNKKAQKNQFKLLFGISFDLFQDIVRRTEFVTLRLILAIFNVSSDSQSYVLASQFNDGILMQNMDNIYHRLMRTRQRSLREVYSSTTVSYISLLETIGVNYDDTTDEMLSAWDLDMNSAGMKPKALYGSVEVIGENNRLQR